MKAVILAGGLGTRLSEETQLRPKPMIEIGGRPILWHIMKTYFHYGINDFVICAGYKGYVIKEYFANYFLHNSDVTFQFNGSSHKIQYESGSCEPWRVTVVDTGEETKTGGRLKRVARYLDAEPFLFTYGDGVADINIAELTQFHSTHGKAATVSAVRMPGRFGALNINADDSIQSFAEKPLEESGWINGGFFVVHPSAFKYIDGDESSWEYDTLPRILNDGELAAYKHHGFWQCMDTLRDKIKLESLWEDRTAPWVVW